jgi:hypothetical protein
MTGARHPTSMGTGRPFRTPSGGWDCQADGASSGGTRPRTTPSGSNIHTSKRIRIRSPGRREYLSGQPDDALTPDAPGGKPPSSAPSTVRGCNRTRPCVPRPLPSCTPRTRRPRSQETRGRHDDSRSRRTGQTHRRYGRLTSQRVCPRVPFGRTHKRVAD